MTAFSLRRRLLGWLLVSTAVLGTLALIDTWREAIRTATEVSDRVLVGSAMAIAERVTLDESGGLQVDIPYSALEMLTSPAQDQVYYRVNGPGGQVLTGYEALSVLPPSADGIALADGAFGEVPIRVATLFREVPTGEEPLEFSVTVAESTRARLELARAILARSAIRLALMIGGAALIVWLTVTLAMQPLRRLGAAISERSPDDLRPIREATPAEVEGIVMAVNSFMGRLDTALAALRNFTGNAGHQLRTPLSVVRMQLALARRAEDAEGAREATEKADTALAQAERVLAQLLLLARVDGAAGQMQARPVDLARLARDVTGEMVPLAARAGVDLGWSGAAEAVVLGEPVLLSEMLRNLIDNALSYGGRGATVTVRVVPGDGVTLEVEDNGPGVSPERLAALAQRRRPADQAAQVGGHGLGLPIVGEIAEIFGARLRLSTGAEGRGFRAAISFPAPGAG
jgi:two-component system sensor histidine kinase TctE